MKVTYTDRWNDYQIRQPTYLDGHFEPDIYDLVKWVKRDVPTEVYSLSEEKYITSYEYCFSVAQIKWDKHEGWFDFESIGTRFLENYIDGLNEWLMDFINELYETKYKYE